MVISEGGAPLPSYANFESPSRQPRPPHRLALGIGMEVRHFIGEITQSGSKDTRQAQKSNMQVKTRMGFVANNYLVDSLHGAHQIPEGCLAFKNDLRSTCR